MSSSDGLARTTRGPQQNGTMLAANAARPGAARRASAPAPANVVGGYRDGEGSRWRVMVCRSGAERWEVCEVAEDKERRVIEELSGADESEGSALALARDFLQQQRRRCAR
jgi:hypothetical protein